MVDGGGGGGGRGRKSRCGHERVKNCNRTVDGGGKKMLFPIAIATAATISVGAGENRRVGRQRRRGRGRGSIGCSPSACSDRQATRDLTIVGMSTDLIILCVQAVGCDFSCEREKK